MTSKWTRRRMAASWPARIGLKPEWLVGQRADFDLRQVSIAAGRVSSFLENVAAVVAAAAAVVGRQADWESGPLVLGHFQF